MTKTKPMPLDEARRAFPVGAHVAFYPIRGLPGFEMTEIRSEVWTLGHGETVVKVEGRTGGVVTTHLALATDEQPPEIACRLAEGRISVRANDKRFRPMIDKLPLHADEAPQGFETRKEATAFAKGVRDAFRKARAALASPD
jgi:hypothetical protein